MVEAIFKPLSCDGIQSLKRKDDVIGAKAG